MKNQKLMLIFSYNISLDTWFKNGSFQREVKLYKYLSKFYDISFLTFGTSQDFKYQKNLKNIRIIPIFNNQRRGKLLDFISSILFIFNNNNIFKDVDVIKTNQLWGSWLAIIIKFIYKKKILLRCGYDLFKNSLLNRDIFFLKIFFYLISLFSYKFSNHIIVTTPKIKNFVIKKFKVKRNKITIIPNYIDISKFKDLKCKKKYSNRILTIGRLASEKNHQMLICSLKNSNYIIDIVGDGILKKEIIGLAKFNKVKINFIDRIDNYKLPKFMSKYPVYVQTSLYEGNPKTILEAMALGIPVIGTDVDGINDIIKNKVNGFLVKINDLSLLKKNIENILIKNISTETISKNSINQINIFNNHLILFKKERIIINKLIYGKFI
jgi:glycosyltransferase involved in cell wall biosynthesis